MSIISEKLEDIRNYLDIEVHPVVSPDKWDVYAALCDMVDDTLALLKAQEPNEDWISRKRLKNEIQYYIDEAGWGDEINRVLGWCLEFIDNQAEVKWELAMGLNRGNGLSRRRAHEPRGETKAGQGECQGDCGDT